MSAESTTPFTPRVIIGVVAAAILALIAYLFLSTYAPPMGGGLNMEANALSKSAVGYSGFVELLQNEGISPILARDDEALNSDGLVIFTPDVDDGDALAKAVQARGGRPTLIILPKYMVAPDVNHLGWVSAGDMIPTEALEQLLSKVTSVKISRIQTTASAGFHNPEMHTIPFNNSPNVQVVAGRELTPVFTDDVDANDIAHDHIILAHDQNIYILADPDLVNNLGIKDPQRAYAALQFLTWPGHSITFDLTLNGFGHGRSLLDLAMRPPFLAMTLALLVAAVMALWAGLVRFGPAMTEPRAIPRGKGALVANTAGLLKLAKVEYQLGGRYAALVRDLAAGQLGLPQGMSAEALTTRLDGLRKSHKFSDLAAQAEAARNGHELLSAAQQLDHWRKGD